MKLLVFADSHGYSGHMLRAAKQEGGVAACFFLGDGERDADKLAAACPALPLYSVRGNCDFGSFLPLEGLAPFGGVLFYYTHGHACGVKQGTGLLWQTARRAGAAVALFGHTHTPCCEEREGVTLFNPGSVALPRGGAPSYGRITLEGGAPVFEIVEL